MLRGGATGYAGYTATKHVSKLVVILYSETICMQSPNLPLLKLSENEADSTFLFFRKHAQNAKLTFAEIASIARPLRVNRLPVQVI